MLHISIKAEKLFEIAGFPVTNSLLSIYLILAFFLIVGWLHQRQLASVSSWLVFVIGYITLNVYRLFESILKDKTPDFFPVLGSFFFFILFANWFGLVPGVESLLIRTDHEAVPLLRGATADLNFTIALAIVSFIIIQWSGVTYVGWKSYLKKFVNFKSPIAFFVGFLETISEFSKIISFAFRLFGNIFAGEVLIAIIAFLIPVLASFPFLMLEIFVGLIQALVFAMLTAVFINTATVKDNH